MGWLGAWQCASLIGPARSGAKIMPSPANFLLPAGRVLLSSLFILGGLNKLLDPAATVAMMQGAGLLLPGLLVWAVIALEMGGGLIVALGLRWHGWAALALAGFTLLANVLFHAFWTMESSAAAIQLSLFFKNIAVAGGLLVVAGLALNPAQRKL
jgi:putative oxidoreductase